MSRGPVALARSTGNPNLVLAETHRSLVPLEFIAARPFALAKDRAAAGWYETDAPAYPEPSRLPNLCLMRSYAWVWAHFEECLEDGVDIAEIGEMTLGGEEVKRLHPGNLRREHPVGAAATRTGRFLVTACDRPQPQSYLCASRHPSGRRSRS